MSSCVDQHQYFSPNPTTRGFTHGKFHFLGSNNSVHLLTKSCLSVPANDKLFHNGLILIRKCFLNLQVQKCQSASFHIWRYSIHSNPNQTKWQSNKSLVKLLLTRLSPNQTSCQNVDCVEPPTVLSQYGCQHLTLRWSNVPKPSSLQTATSKQHSLSTIIQADYVYCSLYIYYFMCCVNFMQTKLNQTIPILNFATSNKTVITTSIIQLDHAL